MRDALSLAWIVVAIAGALVVKHYLGLWGAVAFFAPVFPVGLLFVRYWRDA
jgi:hypothetical protein